MTETTFLDRLRARAQGTLSRAQREELERELAADPALAALAEDFAFVHALSALDPGLGAAPRTRFDEIERHLPWSPLTRRAAAAALVVAAASVAFVAGRWSARDAAPLRLRSIPLNAALAAAPLDDELPRRWASYDPRGADGVRFLTDLAEAEELGRALNRPLLVYGTYQGCPLAAALDERVFADPVVAELVERCVPVRVDLTPLGAAEQRSYVARGYPFLEMWRADGRTTSSLERRPDPAFFVESLHDGLAKSDATGDQPPWDELQGAARAFVRARTDELEGRLAAAERGYRTLVADAPTPVPIAERAARALARMADDARVLLLEARDAARHDPRAGRDLLERALQRFAGTSFGDDLAAAHARLLRDGRFPELVEADPTV